MTEYHDPANVVNPEHDEHHVVTPLQYGMVFGALLIGTILTVVAAKIDMGLFNPIIALGIACTKAVIVILFFMHVKYQSKLVKLTVMCGFFTFLVLITMTLSDYISRAWGLWS
jgi:cytochrome c oxidase subunit IV